MRIMVTAGNTQAPLDQVRCITNIFTGRTGAAIALAAQKRGHTVEVLTSHPDVVARNETWQLPAENPLAVFPYRTFDDLRILMEHHITGGHWDAIVHCAAVSDYRVEGVYHGEPNHQSGEGITRGNMQRLTEGKIKSSHPELWVRVLPTIKLADQIRTAWAFSGSLVIFKLEVEGTVQTLLASADNARRRCGANLVVANSLAGHTHEAFIGPCASLLSRTALEERFTRVPRSLLAETVVQWVEQLQQR